MVLVGLLPLLALASTSSVSGMPIDSPPASPALSIHGQGSATFSPVPTFSPQLNVPSPTLPSAVTVPTGAGSSPLVPSQNQLPGGPSFSNSGNGNVVPAYEGYGTAKGDYNNDNVRGAAGVGRGKGMTNAERMRRGLGILPPTRRMTSKPARRSAKPVVDAAQQPQQQQTANSDETSSQLSDAPGDNSVPDGPSTTDDSGNTTPGSVSGDQSQAQTTANDDGSSSPDSSQPQSQDGASSDTPNSDGDIAQPNGGQTLASKRYVMRMKNPDDGSDMGVVTVPDNDSNPLVGYTPDSNSGNPLTTTFPNDPTSTPFQIAPGFNNDNNGNGDDDDGSFSGPRKLLAAVPHRNGNGNGGGGNGDLGPGNGDYANLGMGWADSSGLLHVGLSALIGATHDVGSTPAGLPLDPSQVTDSDPTSFVAPKQLLSRPLPGGGLPVDPSTLTSGGLPVGGDTDPTHLLHAGLNNVPGLDGLGDVFGSPQSAIWTVYPKSSRLLAHYVNSDGNTVPTYFVTGGECAHTLCLTADVEAFKRAQGDEAHEVHVLAEAVADL
ncbi:hypothetical protein I316_06811 [Kwoniella heveanensis BCC8398]|uniref:Uncharacterized protein n=1 Tax=Kwoniella heveanensis BCC8398 TaxID=1296120 RepID=A0A1B9GKH3_9TREE|nr:hypothetical protein I316_06811 [Kwoniella heveanensis BCC8398]